MPVKRLKKSEETLLTKAAALIRDIADCFNDTTILPTAEGINEIVEQYGEPKSGTPEFAGGPGTTSNPKK